MAADTGPYLVAALFCEQVIEDKGGSLSFIRIVDRMHVQTQGPNAPEQMPPVTLNWNLVLMFKSGQAKGSIAIDIEVEPPSGIRTPKTTMTGYFEGGIRGVNIITKAAMRFTQSGLYWFRIYVAGQFATAIPAEIIYLRTITPVPPQPPQIGGEQ